jgi:ABC-type bacteriocin/lantibiotic exporter with double-glycine peptidase domain
LTRPASATISLKTANFKQSPAMCGPACLKIVASYFGIDIGERRLIRACKSSKISGTTGKNLINGARKFGFHAEIIDNADFKAIGQWLRRGVPVIVDWMSTSEDLRTRQHIVGGHYSVVCGLSRRNIILEDPAMGRRRTIPRQRFFNVWFDFTHAYPKVRDDLILRRLVAIAPRDLTRKAGRQRRKRPGTDATVKKLSRA